MLDFTDTLPRITAGGTGADAIAKFKNLVDAIEEALNKLSLGISSLSNKSALVRKYAPLAVDVGLGDLVYFNYANSRFEKAQALLLADNGSQGESIEAPQARVEGMVIQLDEESDVTGTVTGTLLCGGYWDSELCITACAGINPTAGMYFLSGMYPGKATKSPGTGFRQPVFSYYGDGKFYIGTHYLAHDNHFHSTAVLSRSWLSAATVEELKPGVTRPEGAQWGYAVEDDSDCADLGEIDNGITAVFYNGSLKLPGAQSDFIIADGILWSSSQTEPVAGRTALFNHYPFAYGSPVVRSIRSANDFITVSQPNGNVVLTAAAFEQDSVARNNLAVSWVQGKKLKMTPVITAVNQGPGARVLQGADGAVTIAVADKVNSPIDAYSINHNGTHPASDGTFLYTMFPAGRSASLIMSLPVTGNSSDTQQTALVWGALTGAGAAFNVKLYWSPLPEDAATEADLPSAANPGEVTSLAFTGTSAGKLVYAESASGLDITGNGTLYAEVAITSAPSDDIKLTRLGFKLLAGEGASSQSGSGNADNIGTALVNTMQAGVTLNAFRAVKISNNKLAACYSAEEADCDTCIGVSITSGLPNESVDYVVYGVVKNITGVTLVPGSPVYVGTSGELTQVNPATVSSAKFIQKVGIALSADALQVGIRPGILKET